VFFVFFFSAPDHLLGVFGAHLSLLRRPTQHSGITLFWSLRRRRPRYGRFHVGCFLQSVNYGLRPPRGGGRKKPKVLVRGVGGKNPYTLRPGFCSLLLPLSEYSHVWVNSPPKELSRPWGGSHDLPLTPFRGFFFFRRRFNGTIRNQQNQFARGFEAVHENFPLLKVFKWLTTKKFFSGAEQAVLTNGPKRLGY